MNTKNYYTTREAAEIVGITPRAVCIQIKKKNVKVHRIGRSYLIPKSFIENYEKFKEKRGRKT